ncbi:hypothetical protein DSL92_08570 [Billgrantia gudaonensis]|uniref:Uncharacterized protein n=1 Tax=Billgrantia gudaonensis TaxID=376427 RepID=A0A3S0NEB1_9GAMM|nr:hypothetical protein DSL92_08570 [Halomonas gudaonensis]
MVAVQAVMPSGFGAALRAGQRGWPTPDPWRPAAVRGGRFLTQLLTASHLLDDFTVANVG